MNEEEQQWIIVPNWERFQHYGQARRPTWIKNYIGLLHKDEYLDLTLAERGLLHGVWLAYAEAQGRLRTGDLSSDLHALARHRHIESLNHAGLIEFSASRPLLLNLEVPNHARGENGDAPESNRNGSGDLDIKQALNVVTGCSHLHCRELEACYYE